jgi:hypothetical protein
MDLLKRAFRRCNWCESCDRYRIDVLRGYVASIDMVDVEWWCRFIALGLATAVLALGSHSALAARSLDFCIGNARGIGFRCISITEVNLPGKRHREDRNIKMSS